MDPGLVARLINFEKWDGRPAVNSDAARTTSLVIRDQEQFSLESVRTPLEPA